MLHKLAKISKMNKANAKKGGWIDEIFTLLGVLWFYMMFTVNPMLKHVISIHSDESSFMQLGVRISSKFSVWL